MAFLPNYWHTGGSNFGAEDGMRLLWRLKYHPSLKNQFMGSPVSEVSWGHPMVTPPAVGGDVAVIQSSFSKASRPPARGAEATHRAEMHSFQIGFDVSENRTLNKPDSLICCTFCFHASGRCPRSSTKNMIRSLRKNAYNA